jgi:hypothetical protein
LHGIAHALSSEPWSLVRGATAINSPLGLTSTSFVAMVALFDGVNLAAFSASSPWRQNTAKVATPQRGGLLRHSTKAPVCRHIEWRNPAGRILYLRSGPTQAITEMGDDAWCAPGTKVTLPRNYTLLTGQGRVGLTWEQAFERLNQVKDLGGDVRVLGGDEGARLLVNEGAIGADHRVFGGFDGNERAGEGARHWDREHQDQPRDDPVQPLVDPLA